MMVVVPLVVPAAVEIFRVRRKATFEQEIGLPAGVWADWGISRKNHLHTESHFILIPSHQENLLLDVDDDPR